MARLLAEQPYDALVCDFLVPAVNLPARVPCPTLLFTHNVEAEIWRRHAETEGRAWRRTLLRSQWRRMLRFEGRALSRLDSVLAVSEADRETFARLYPGRLRAPVRVIPTGVDTQYFGAAADVPFDPHHLVFTGSMDWLPNEDAVLYFCQRDPASHSPRRAEASRCRSWAAIRRRRSAASPSRSPASRSRGAWSTSGRTWAARRCRSCRFGSAAARASRSTKRWPWGGRSSPRRIGAEGLPLAPGHDLAIADDPDAFARAVLTLLSDPAGRQRMADAARHLVAERYDWSAVAGTLEDAVRRRPADPARSSLASRSSFGEVEVLRLIMKSPSSVSATSGACRLRPWRATATRWSASTSTPTR